MGHKKILGIEFQHTMRVDQSHRVYYTGDVNVYYARIQMYGDSIRRDIEAMLDDFNITDYKELYLFFENDEMKLVSLRKK